MTKKKTDRKPPEYWFSEFDRYELIASQNEEEAVYSLYDHYERNNPQNESDKIIYSTHDLHALKEEDTPAFAMDTIYMNTGDITRLLFWVDKIKDFIDVESLIEAMSLFGMGLPRNVVFTEPNWLFKRYGVTGWTYSLATETINIDLDLLITENGLLIVENIAHETWHLSKQPLFLRKFGRIYETEAEEMGRLVANEYLRLMIKRKVDKHIKRKHSE